MLYYSTSVYNFVGTFVQVTNWTLSQVISMEICYLRPDRCCWEIVGISAASLPTGQRQSIRPDPADPFTSSHCHVRLFRCYWTLVTELTTSRNKKTWYVERRNRSIGCAIPRNDESSDYLVLSQGNRMASLSSLSRVPSNA